MTKEKAIRMALSLVLDRAFEASENYGLERAARGFEREFAEAMACADILKTMMGPPQTLAFEGEEEEQRKTESFPRRKAIYKGACDDVAAEA